MPCCGGAGSRGGAASTLSPADPGKPFPRSIWDGVKERKEKDKRRNPPATGLPAVLSPGSSVEQSLFSFKPVSHGREAHRVQQVASAAPVDLRKPMSLPSPSLPLPLSRLSSGTRFGGGCGASRVEQAPGRGVAGAPAQPPRRSGRVRMRMLCPSTARRYLFHASSAAHRCPETPGAPGPAFEAPEWGG